MSHNTMHQSWMKLNFPEGYLDRCHNSHCANHTYKAGKGHDGPSPVGFRWLTWKSRGAFWMPQRTPRHRLMCVCVWEMMRAEIGADGVCAVCEIGNGWLALSISTCLTTLANLLLSALFLWLLVMVWNINECESALCNLSTGAGRTVFTPMRHSNFMNPSAWVNKVGVVQNICLLKLTTQFNIGGEAFVKLKKVGTFVSSHKPEGKVLLYVTKTTPLSVVYSLHYMCYMKVNLPFSNNSKPDF